MSSAKILELRALIHEREGRHSRDRFPSSSLSCGIPRGAITEISGTAKVEWLIQFLIDNPALKVFWAEATFSLMPQSLNQRGLDPRRLLFAECGDELFQAVRMALRCQIFECLVVPSVFAEEKLLKAIQLLSEKANCSVLLLTEEHRASWPIAVQFAVKHGREGRGFEIELRKNKQPKTVEPEVTV